MAACLVMATAVAIAAAGTAGAQTSRESGATVREYRKVIRTYPFSDPNPVPQMGRIYPYFRFDGYTDHPVDREWTVVEIENVLYRHPSVRQVAIVAMPDERLGERGCAFVVLREASALEFAGMQEFLRKSGVARSYWPERLELVDALPMTATGITSCPQ